MEAVPETKYVRADDGTYIAYQIMGDGPIDLLVCFGWALSIEDQIDGWHCGRFLRRLATFSRVIRFDRRGVGLSDPLVTIDQNTLEQWCDDALTVLDEVGSSAAAILAEGGGGRFSLLLAGTHPNRVSHLVLFNGTARAMTAPDYPIGHSPDEATALIEGAPVLLTSGAIPYADECPSVASDEAFKEWFLRSWRRAAGPSVLQMLTRTAFLSDLRAILPAILVPTLVLYRPLPPRLPQFATYLADHIVNSQLVEVPGRDAMVFVGESDRVVQEVETFLTGTCPQVEVDRVLATVLFTDIVSSTERASALGDKAWHDLLDRYRAMVREHLHRFRGHEINTRGDDFLATFDGPARAIRCALAITEATKALGLEARTGLHTGEVELMGDDIGGVAVHIGARVSEISGPGEVVVSRTVVDLVAGSGITFEDRGDHALKGVPGAWRLFAAEG